MKVRVIACLVAGTLLVTAPAKAQSKPSTIPPKTFVLEAPSGAKTIGEATSAKPGDKITIQGEVAGTNAFEAGKATVVLKDPASDKTALVRVVNDKGQPLPTELKGWRGLNPGAKVTVKGKRAAGEGVVVDAEAICVTAPAVPDGFMLTQEPKDAKWIEDLRAGAKVGQPIAVRGYVGGSVTPFVEGRAVVTLVGKGLPSCADKGTDHCKTPWDYCCETAKDIAAHSVTVQVADPAGGVLRTTLKSDKVKELAEVIVVGTVAVADGKSLIVNATGVYAVEKPAK